MLSVLGKIIFLDVYSTGQLGVGMAESMTLHTHQSISYMPISHTIPYCTKWTAG